jgi:hypothetical protein
MDPPDLRTALAAVVVKRGGWPLAKDPRVRAVLASGIGSVSLAPVPLSSFAGAVDPSRSSAGYLARSASSPSGRRSGSGPVADRVARDRRHATTTCQGQVRDAEMAGIHAVSTGQR